MKSKEEKTDNSSGVHFEKNFTIKITIINALTSILVLTIGIFLNNHYSEKNYIDRHSKELKEECYSKLSGIRHIFVFHLNSFLENRVQGEYFMVRYMKITKLQQDFELSKESNETAFKHNTEIPIVRKELYEILGKIQIAFSFNGRVNAAVDSVYKMKGYEVGQWMYGTIETFEELEKVKHIILKEIDSYISKEIEEKIDLLLNEMAIEIKKES